MAKRHALFATAFIAVIAPASAEESPNRPITWLVPFTPGAITPAGSHPVAETTE